MPKFVVTEPGETFDFGVLVNAAPDKKGARPARKPRRLAWNRYNGAVFGTRGRLRAGVVPDFGFGDDDE